MMEIFLGRAAKGASVSTAGSRLRRISLAALALIIIFTVSIPCVVFGEDDDTADSRMRPSELYARYAVLMDADSGRVLFSKSGDTEAPMASTTKIMTCILALENGGLTDEVEISDEAASQPQVKLGVRTGQKFYLNDLLYSLMLESHNDAAVAIAEHIGGSVQGFADMMNEKAAVLECDSTYFITPNGLDSEDENGIHHTTAKDLAGIMKYCIMDSLEKDKFLEITRTSSYTFSDCEESGSYTCTNHNAFLKMMEGALTGKTGFTADAGYCYVGALRQDDRRFIVALLACGWPNNKGYKWADARKLMTYGLKNYDYVDLNPSSESKTAGSDMKIFVENGYKGGFPTKSPVSVDLHAQGNKTRILLRNDEEIETVIRLPDAVNAPLPADSRIGEIMYKINGSTIASYPLLTDDTTVERTFKICLDYVRNRFFGITDIKINQVK